MLLIPGEITSLPLLVKVAFEMIACAIELNLSDLSVEHLNRRILLVCVDRSFILLSHIVGPRVVQQIDRAFNLGLALPRL